MYNHMDSEPVAQCHIQYRIYGPYTVNTAKTLHTAYIYGRPKPMYNHMDTDTEGNCHIGYD
jgi:hypothetical protein